MFHYAAYDFTRRIVASSHSIMEVFATNTADIFGAAHIDSFENIFRAEAAMHERIAKDYTNPGFQLKNTVIDGRNVAVTEETALSLPFGNLVHFKRDTDKADPKVLLVAPMSGHYASLVRDTARAMLPDHDVYVTDWANARDVPVSAGKFDLGDYADYVRQFMTRIGPNNHVVAVCQSTVPVLAAVAMMAEDQDPNRPLSMTLMAGPIDARQNPGKVNEFAVSQPIRWFEQNLISRVPPNYDGAGRQVYAGHVQLASFVTMNPERHLKSHIDMFSDMVRGDFAKAAKGMGFYDDYFAVLDMTKEFYIETVSKVFQEHSLPKGELVLNGRPIRPEFIDSALFTVEGERDDICGLGQTQAAHTLCINTPSEHRFHHVEPAVGHYGVFSGKSWAGRIYPRVNQFIEAANVDNSLKEARKIPDTGQLPSNSGKKSLTAPEAALA